ncbi:hypothetical protein HWV62_11684 [Athelia sp. TMB]|nr:hypothetical protein HWV62_11684 [Athelia sp. TMB]
MKLTFRGSELLWIRTSQVSDLTRVVAVLGGKNYNVSDLGKELHPATLIGQLNVQPVSNAVIRLLREAPWEEQHSEIQGPQAAVYYFGPDKGPGYVMFGNAPKITMVDMMLHKKDSSTSRYFKSQSGKECKWRLSPRRMECIAGRTTLALWELSEPEDIFHARLTIQPAGLPIVTEIVTTLTLNRMVATLDWQT